MAWYIGLGALGVLAAIYPWQLGVKADPFAPAPAGIKPEWYFLFMFQTLKVLPAKLWRLDGEVVGVLAFGVAAFAWLALPFADRASRGTARLIMAIGLIALAYIGAMTVYGYVAQ